MLGKPSIKILSATKGTNISASYLRRMISQNVNRLTHTDWQGDKVRTEICESAAFRNRVYSNFGEIDGKPIWQSNILKTCNLNWEMEIPYAALGLIESSSHEIHEMTERESTVTEYFLEEFEQKISLPKFFHFSFFSRQLVMTPNDHRRILNWFHNITWILNFTRKKNAGYRSNEWKHADQNGDTKLQ